MKKATKVSLRRLLDGLAVMLNSGNSYIIISDDAAMIEELNHPATDNKHCIEGLLLTGDYSVPESHLHGSVVFLRKFENIDRIIDIFHAKHGMRVPYLHIEAEITGDQLIALNTHLAQNVDIYRITATNLGVDVSGHYAPYDVTVIVPVYGVEDYIERCAKSLRDQSFNGSYEVLFVDDGSPDNSVEIIQNIILNHPHMKVLPKHNGGAASARNLGIKAAQGKYIAFVDGDDYVTPDYIDSLFRPALFNDADISQAEFIYVNATTGEHSHHHEWFPTQQGITGPISQPAYTMMLQTPGIWRRLYKKSLLDFYQTEFFEGFRRHDDLPFNIEVLTNANHIAIARKPVYYYILGRDGQDVGATDARLFIHFRLFEYTKSRITSMYWQRPFYRTYLITMFAHHLWAYDRIDEKLKSEYLRGMAQQVFNDDGPISWFSRYKTLRRHFGDQRTLVRRAALMSLLPKKPLPSDIER